MKRKSSTARDPNPRSAGDVDAYLASLPADRRAALQKLRKTIRSAAPGAEEGFSYGLPAFRLVGRPLVCFGSARNHCSFFPMSPKVIAANKSALKGYDISKGTIRFLPERPLPDVLVKKIVRARVAELEQRRKSPT